MLALAEKMQVEIAELGRKAIGIVCDVVAAGVVTPDEPITRRYVGFGSLPLEDVRSFDAPHDAVPLRDADLLRVGQDGTDGRSVARQVAAENGERIPVFCFDQFLEFRGEFRFAHPVIPLPGRNQAGIFT